MPTTGLSFLEESTASNIESYNRSVSCICSDDWRLTRIECLKMAARLWVGWVVGRVNRLASSIVSFITSGSTPKRHNCLCRVVAYMLRLELGLVLSLWNNLRHGHRHPVEEYPTLTYSQLAYARILWHSRGPST
jgi:hypothetical protein